MRFELIGRHVDITPSLRRLVNTKLAKLERLLNNSAVSARAVVTQERYRLKTDITLHARGVKFLHGVGSSAAWEASVDQAIAKIAQQALKVKGKYQERKRHGPRRVVAAEAEPRAEGGAGLGSDRGAKSPVGRGRTEGRPRMPRILKSSRQAIKSMSVAEAARAIDSRDDDLVVFHDPERSSICVLYRRNGELTLVETET